MWETLKVSTPDLDSGSANNLTWTFLCENYFVCTTCFEKVSCQRAFVVLLFFRPSTAETRKIFCQSELTLQGWFSLQHYNVNTYLRSKSTSLLFLYWPFPQENRSFLPFPPRKPGRVWYHHFLKDLNCNFIMRKRHWRHRVSRVSCPEGNGVGTGPSGASSNQYKPIDNVSGTETVCRGLGKYKSIETDLFYVLQTTGRWDLKILSFFSTHKFGEKTQKRFLLHA